MATFTVTQTTDNGLGNIAGTLSYAVFQANQLAGDDAIILNNNVRLTGPTVIASFIDSNISLEGNGFSLSGDVNGNGINDLGDTRPLFIKSGIVSISNLTITNGRAQGENGSGGGAGMGGGLFIYDGAVNLTNVAFLNNAAIGGNGGFSGRGGGMGIPGIPANNGTDGARGANGGNASGNIPGGAGENGNPGSHGGIGGNGGRGGDGGKGGSNGWADDGGYLQGGFGGLGGNGGDGGWGGNGGQGGDGGRSGIFKGFGSGRGGYGGNGGFGGGGGIGGKDFGEGGNGGFGGGGGQEGLAVYGHDPGPGGDGGYGGGGSRSGSGGVGGGNGWYQAGGGAGMGGGLFIRSGSLNFKNLTFTNNSAVGGTGVFIDHWGDGITENGQGLGGGLFIMQSLTNSNGNNQGMPTVLPTVAANGLVIFSGNSAADDSGTVTDNDDIWGGIATVSNVIMGTEGDDILVGTSADDLMIGLGGNDRLDGKGGADEMRGGLGNDTYTVNNPGDLVIENTDEGTDAVKASVTYALPDHVENLTLTGTGNLDGTGNALNNKLTGNNGDNVLMGGAGNDTLDGKAGNDLLQGETGDDTYLYRHPGSVIVENPNEGTDTVKAYFSYGLGANLENLILIGADDLDGIGNSLNNALTGNSGDNLLNGGPGADTLTGKAGTDVFIFNFGQSLVNAPDRIKDFALGEDKIDLLTQGGGNANTPVSLTRAADSKAATLTEVMTQVFIDADGALEGNQALGINSAALVKVLTADIRGTYLVVNNSNARFQADKDLLINITGLNGGLPNFGAIAVDSFFV